MKDMKQWIIDLMKTVVGSALFALGFDLFLQPNHLNAGGLSGLSMLLVYLIQFGSIGTVTALLNLPLFLLGGLKVGKKFFVGSLVGMVFSSLFIDLFTLIPVPPTDPLLALCLLAAVPPVARILLYGF